MIVSINQPAYMPWLGYFQRIAVSDLHVILDHVQFEKNSFTNRNRIRTAAGWTWLTVPVRTGGRFGQLELSSIEIVDDGTWCRKHWQTIRQAYAKAPYFAPHEAFFAGLYERPWQKLTDLMTAVTNYLLVAFGITTPMRRSSAMSVAGTKSDLVVNLCVATGATTYLSGPLGRDYLDPAAFAQRGIQLLFQDYRHPRYAQAHSGFEANMAAVDLLFNHGPASRDILMAGEKPALTEHGHG